MRVRLRGALSLLAASFALASCSTNHAANRPRTAGTILSWVIVPSPNPGGPYGSSLSSVSCARPSFCMAVGSQGTAQANHANATLAEHWDGHTWSVVPTLNPPVGAIVSASPGLTGVSCTSLTFCVAVGYVGLGDISTYEAFIEQWDGNSWSMVPPSPFGIPPSTPGAFPGGGSAVSGVSCTARHSALLLEPSIPVRPQLRLASS